METIAFCEFDKHAQNVLKKHWPDVPIYDDIRTLDGRQFKGSIDLVCGGYPCQPFSTAGKRRGAEDYRHLWPEFLRIIKEAKPAWVLCENVVGHISMGLDSVLSDLEDESYTCQALIIPAVAVDAKHRRDRVWIIGARSLADSSSRRLSEQKKREMELKRGAEIISTGDTMANSNSDGLQVGNERKCPKKENGALKGCKSIGRSSKGWFCNRRFKQWETEPGVGRVVDGFPGRVDRIKRLGNAVVPQIPEIIGRAIMASNNQ